MRPVLLLAVGALCVALLLPTTAVASLPTTPGEQAQWLGDCYAAGLDHYYGRYGLTAEAIQTTRGDFVFRLSGLLDRPLDRQQLSTISAWLFRSSVCIGALDLAPPADRLRQEAADNSHIIGLYLSRPRLTHEQGDEIAGQLGIVLDVLRAAMLEEFSDIPGAEALVRTAIYARAADFGRLIKDPISPLIKRPYTAAEIEDLCAYARKLPVGEAEGILESALRSAATMDTQTPEFEERAAETARWMIHGVTWSLKSKVMGSQYAPPQVLSAEERAALSDYYMTTHGALWDDPEGMRERAEEEPW